MRYDVVVVGGGPAGSAAAIWCARAGLDVLAVDKARFPRDKTCGDGLTAGALRELDTLGYDCRPVSQPVRWTEVFGPYEQRLLLDSTLTSGGLLCAVMRRSDLDAALWDLAAANGAKAEEGVSFVGLQDDGRTVTVDLADASGPKRVSARWVIGADGAHSAVRKAALGPSKVRMPGMQALRQYCDAPPSDLLSIFFRADLLPGYGWIFPLPGGGLNIGIGVQRDPAIHGKETSAALTNDKGRVRLQGLARLYRRFLAMDEVRQRLGDALDPDDPTVDTKVQAWPIPSDPEVSAVSAGRVLLTGDAARVVDPMTGEGIGQALASARLAVETIISGGPPLGVAARYREVLDREIGRDLRFARFLNKATRHRRGIEWGLAIAGTSNWTRRNFVRWLYEDYPRSFVLTPDRWRRHSMRGVGGYGL